MQHTHAGILLVSFGTSIQHAKLTAIDAIKLRIQTEFPSFTVYEAWTSDFLRRKVKEQEGISIPNPSEALRQMLLDGIRTVIIQPTFVIPGAEYRQMHSGSCRRFFNCDDRHTASHLSERCVRSSQGNRKPRKRYLSMHGSRYDHFYGTWRFARRFSCVERLLCYGPGIQSKCALRSC